MTYTTHQQDIDADWAGYEEAIRAYEQSQQLMSDQEVLDHETVVIEGSIDRNGFPAVIDWILAYAADSNYEIRAAMKRKLELAKGTQTYQNWLESPGNTTSDEFFCWSPATAGDPIRDDLF